MTAAATAALPLSGDAVLCTADDCARAIAGGRIFRRRCLNAEGHVEEEHRWSGWTPTGEVVTEDFDPHARF